MAKKPETALQVKIQKAIKAKFPNSWLFKVWGGPFMPAGIPDLVGCVQGVFVALEIKVPLTGEPSAIQLETMEEIRSAGGVAWLIDSVEEALWVVEAATKLLRFIIDEDTGCWNYIHESAGTKINGKFWRIPRLSWTLFKGPIPRDLFVCHECDNPRCMNPDHLWLGTHQDNVDDREAKGRGRVLRGEDSPRSKITWDDVLAIRDKRLIRGSTLKVLARQYGISIAQVSLICSRKKWRRKR